MSEAVGGEPCGPTRIAGLDAWRAGLMLGGLLVHGSLWQQPHPLFDLIELASHSFRMGTFFAISGYLAACAMQRRAADVWLRGRLLTLGVPLLFGMATIAPFMWWLAQLHGGALAAAALPFDWHHMWFLVALLLYSAAAARWAEPTTRWFARAFDDERPLWTILLATATVSGALMALCGSLVLATAPSAWYGPLANARLIGGYLPMFALGYLAARNIRLREVVLANRIAPAAILAAVTAAYCFWFLALRGESGAVAVLVGRTLPQLGAALCPPAVFALVLQTAVRMKHVPRIVQVLCDASFTVYLVHVPVLAAINTGFASVGWNPVVEFGIATATAGVLSLAFHRLVVRRSPLLLLLLNGKPLGLRLPRWPGSATT